MSDRHIQGFLAISEQENPIEVKNMCQESYQDVVWMTSIHNIHDVKARTTTERKYESKHSAGLWHGLQRFM
jgi:hypothetical protein